MPRYRKFHFVSIVYVLLYLSGLAFTSPYKPLKCGKPADLPCLENLVKFCRGSSKHLDLIIGVCSEECLNHFCFKTSGSQCCNWYHARCRRNRFEGCSSISEASASCSKPFVKLLCPSACGICNRIV